MSSQGLFSIGGIASGIDTSSMIDQLMRLERQPVVRLQSTQASLRQVDGAWNQVNTQLSSLRTAVDRLARTDRFDDLVAVSSSNADAVTVARGTGTQTGTLAFRVTQLAQAHQVASAGLSGNDTPLGDGTFSVTVGGVSTSVEVRDGMTLDQLAAALNAGDGGFSASVVKVAADQHRLVLTSATTGAAHGLAVDSSVDELDPGAFTTTSAARDAQVTLGTGTDAITITRPSNTIGDLVPGTTITLRKLTTEAVEVGSRRDVDGGVAAVEEYVDALNSAVGLLAELTRYNPDTRTAGLLQGDPMARQLLDELRGAAAGANTAGGSLAAAGIGLSVDRAGKVVLDEVKLRTALTDDFGAVGRLFARTGTATSDAVTSVVGGPATRNGAYTIEVSRAAELARAVGGVISPPGEDFQPKTLRVTSGGRTIELTVDERYTTTQEVVAALNAALAEQGLTSLRASVGDGDRLQLAESRYGSAASFTVAALGADGEALDAADDDAFGLAGEHRGTDVAGTVIGPGGSEVPFTGTGRSISVAEGPGQGLFVTYRGGPGEFGVTFSQGLAGNVGATLARAEGIEGLVARARGGITSQIAVYQTRIDGFDQRLATREATLRRQFTAMETALATLQSQGSWLASQLPGLNNLYAQQR